MRNDRPIAGISVGCHANILLLLLLGCLAASNDVLTVTSKSTGAIRAKDAPGARQLVGGGALTVIFRAPARNDCVRQGSVLPIKWFVFNNADATTSVKVKVTNNGLDTELASGVTLDDLSLPAGNWSVPATINAGAYQMTMTVTSGTYQGNTYRSELFIIQASTDSSPCQLADTTTDMALPFIVLDTMSCAAISGRASLDFFYTGYAAGTNISVSLVDAHLTLPGTFLTNITLGAASNIMLNMPNAANPHSYWIRMTVRTGAFAGRVINSNPFSLLPSCGAGLYEPSIKFRIPNTGTNYMDCFFKGLPQNITWYHGGWAPNAAGRLLLMRDNTLVTVLAANIYPTITTVVANFSSLIPDSRYRIVFRVTNGTYAGTDFPSGYFNLRDQGTADFCGTTITTQSSTAPYLSMTTGNCEQRSQYSSFVYFSDGFNISSTGPIYLVNATNASEILATFSASQSPSQVNFLTADTSQVYASQVQIQWQIIAGLSQGSYYSGNIQYMDACRNDGGGGNNGGGGHDGPILIFSSPMPYMDCFIAGNTYLAQWQSSGYDETTYGQLSIQKEYPDLRVHSTATVLPNVSIAVTTGVNFTVPSDLTSGNYYIAFHMIAGTGAGDIMVGGPFTVAASNEAAGCVALPSSSDPSEPWAYIITDACVAPGATFRGNLIGFNYAAGSTATVTVGDPTTLQQLGTVATDASFDHGVDVQFTVPAAMERWEPYMWNITVTNGAGRIPYFANAAFRVTSSCTGTASLVFSSPVNASSHATGSILPVVWAGYHISSGMRMSIQLVSSDDGATYTINGDAKVVESYGPSGFETHGSAPVPLDFTYSAGTYRIKTSANTGQRDLTVWWSDEFYITAGVENTGTGDNAPSLTLVYPEADAVFLVGSSVGISWDYINMADSDRFLVTYGLADDVTMSETGPSEGVRVDAGPQTLVLPEEVPAGTSLFVQIWSPFYTLTSSSVSPLYVVDGPSLMTISQPSAGQVVRAGQTLSVHFALAAFTPGQPCSIALCTSDDNVCMENFGFATATTAVATNGDVRTFYAVNTPLPYTQAPGNYYMRLNASRDDGTLLSLDGTNFTIAVPLPTTSPSSSRSPSPSMSPSPSSSVSPTGSGSISASVTATMSGSATRTVSPSGSETGSMTNSVSSTVTTSGSRSPSSSTSPSGSITNTASASVSVSGSVSVSSTITMTVSTSPSATATMSYTATPSYSATASITFTSSAGSSHSETPTQSVSVTRTHSPSGSPSGSTSPSNSYSATPSESGTVSPSGSTGASVSETSSHSPSESISVSATPSSSESTSASPSESTSVSSTASSTESSTASFTSFPTFPPTHTATMTSIPSMVLESASVSMSETRSRDGTHTATRSVSPTVAVSGASTPSSTGTSGASITGTSTRTGSGTGTASSSVSGSRAPSGSTTVVASTAPASPSSTASRTVSPSAATGSATGSNLPSQSVLASPTSTLAASASASTSASMLGSTSPSSAATRSHTPSTSSTPRPTVSMAATLSPGLTRTILRDSVCKLSAGSVPFSVGVACSPLSLPSIPGLNVTLLTAIDSFVDSHIQLPVNGIKPGTVARLDCPSPSSQLSRGFQLYMCDLDGKWRAATSLAWFNQPTVEAPLAMVATAVLFGNFPTDALPAAAPTSASVVQLGIACDARVQEVQYECLSTTLGQPSLPTASVCNDTVRVTWGEGPLPSWTSTTTLSWSADMLASRQLATLQSFIPAPAASASLMLVVGVDSDAQPDGVVLAARSLLVHAAQELSMLDISQWPANVSAINSTTVLSCSSGSYCATVLVFGLNLQVITYSVVDPYLASKRAAMDLPAIDFLLGVTMSAVDRLAADTNQTFADAVLNMLTVGLVSRVSGPFGTPTADIYGPVSVVLNMSLWNSARIDSVNNDAVNGTFSLASVVDIPSSCAFVTSQVYLSVTGVESTITSSAIVMTDIFPASNIIIRFSAKPLADEILLVSCTPEHFSDYITLNPVSQLLTRSAYELASPIGTAQFQVLMKPIPSTASAGSSAVATRIVCNVTHTASAPRNVYQTPIVLSVGATLLRAKWALFSDVVLETRTGALRSAWSSEVAHLPDLRGCGDSCSEDNVTKLWEFPVDTWSDYILSVAQPQQVGQIFSLALSGATNITLVADQVNPRDLRVGFTPDTQVYFNGVACKVSWLSDDRKLLRVETPSYASICPSSNSTPAGVCGSSSLIVKPGSVPLSDVVSIMRGDDSSTDLLQTLIHGNDAAFSAPISCPPLCPGQASTTPFKVTDVRTETGSGRLLSATTATTRQLLTSSYGSRVTTTAAFSSAGIQYSEKCDGIAFVSPETGICTNASNPDHRKCAFGAADQCVQCPVGALCPGGFRAWPVAGYYTPNEYLAPVACPPPASDRCTGWSSTLNAVECGVGYRQGSPSCRACAYAFYQDKLSGRCEPCVDSSNPWTIIQPVLVFIGALVGIGCVMYAIILVIVRIYGGSMKRGAKLTLAFIISTFSAIQNVVTIGREAEPGLPPLLRGVYDSFGFLQFQGVTIHPECLAVTTGPFFNLEVQFIIIMSLLLIWALGMVWGEERAAFKRTKATVMPMSAPSGELRLGSLVQADSVRAFPSEESGKPAPFSPITQHADAKEKKPRKFFSTLRKVVFTLLGVLYATITTQSLSTVWCVSHGMSVRAYLDLDTDGATLRHSAIPATLAELKACLEDPYSSDCNGKAAFLDAPLEVTVINAQPSIVCYERDHSWAVILAWVILACYSVGYPIVMFYSLRAWMLLQVRLSTRYDLWNATMQTHQQRQQEYVETWPVHARGIAWLRLVVCGLRKNTRGAHAPIKIAPGVDSAYPLSPSGTKVIILRVNSNQTLEASPPGAGVMSMRHLPGSVPIEGEAADTTTTTTSVPPHAAAVKHEIVLPDADPVEPDTVSTATARSALASRQASGFAPTGLPPTDRDLAMLTPDSVVDRDPVVLKTKVYAPFFDADYRPSKFYFAHLNLALLLALLIIGQIFQDSGSDNEDIAQFVATAAVLFLMLYAYMRLRPFKRDETVPQTVELYGVILCILEAIVNCVNSIVRRFFAAQFLASLLSDQTLTIDSLPPTPLVYGLQVVCYSVVVASAGLFVVIIVGYIVTVMREAPKHRVHLRRKSSHIITHWDGSVRPGTRGSAV